MTAKYFLVTNPDREEFSTRLRYLAPGNPPEFDGVILCTDENTGASKLFLDSEVVEASCSEAEHVKKLAAWAKELTLPKC